MIANYTAKILLAPVFAAPRPPAAGDILFLTTSLEGNITGGDRRFRHATGTVTVAGKISVCDLATDVHCVVSPPLPIPGLGVRYDCHFVLRGNNERPKS